MDRMCAILAEIPSLSSDQKVTLANALKADGVLTELPPIVERESDKRFVLGVFRSVCPDIGLGNVSGLFDRLPPGFGKKCTFVLDFLREQTDDELVIQSILSRGIKILYGDMLHMKVPVSHVTLLNQVHRIPALLNRAFPGYALCKMLPVIVKRVR